ncbi:MAG: KpsF/GutQ family sugar-phosphate isomerase [Alphaproteobacteria bacterium]|nr:KpsF/GutQ family sugar-phosphate isomerase [Alphaproteobacteria bacterium]
MTGSFRSRTPVETDGDARSGGASLRRTIAKAKESSDIAVARRVLDTEIVGLEALAAELDASFADAVDKLAAITGRVTVTGMGKSGHVARKIASTLASTGTPAQFVHPAEASHGDLGMLAAGDAVLALSNSGETNELADILAHARRFGMPLIAITAQARSALADAADVTLRLPAAAEACSMGLAPTTSTTMMMALGDALAIALLERKGFSADDFQQLHPGGRLGRRLLKVADIMHHGPAVPLIPLDTAMADAILAMTKKSFGCVGITDAAGRLAGIVTDGDLRRHMGDGLLRAGVAEVMSQLPKTIRPQALAAEALAVMNQNAITSLFVVDAANKPLGIVHIHDCLRAGIA